MKTASPISSDDQRRLINLAGYFAYPTPLLAEKLKVPLTELEHNHIRLFINDLGGVKTPPYAGCYLNSCDRRQFMIDFSGFCQTHGIVLGSGHPPDHIPAMLEVLALLLAESPGEETAELSSMIGPYYRDWPQGFAAALAEHDTIGFYAAIGAEIEKALATLTG
ncbi:molecular chaperone TorD family protein [Desulfurivibrio sp. C05AmB]|uniref:molecular chaperone TorD family protein n=1 Tax=Desulfurivibrio sp. C05AmB TaxID=3374371 RepID=UPI00376F1F0D